MKIQQEISFIVWFYTSIKVLERHSDYSVIHLDEYDYRNPKDIHPIFVTTSSEISFRCDLALVKKGFILKTNLRLVYQFIRHTLFLDEVWDCFGDLVVGRETVEHWLGLWLLNGEKLSCITVSHLIIRLNIVVLGFLKYMLTTRRSNLWFHSHSLLQN